MLPVENGTAVVTGGASGIGLALATEWVARGGNVVLGDLDQAGLARAQEQLGGPRRCATVVCDVTSEQDCAQLARRAVEEFGGINLVAPFAGIIADGMLVSTDKSSGRVSRKMPLEQFKKVVDINLVGVFLTVRECVEQMVNTESRGLVCLVSSTGSLGTAGQLSYSSTKAAMSVFPKVMTAELFRRGLSDRIRANAVAPGYVGTAMVKGMNQKALQGILANVPIKRLVDPAEVVSLVLELYRNEALAGETFFVHGGLRIGSKG